VTWQVPESDGNSPITGYIVQMAVASDLKFTTFGQSDSNTFKCKVSSLDKDKKYLVQVLAVNAVGQSEPACHPEPVLLQSGECELLLR